MHFGESKEMAGRISSKDQMFSVQCYMVGSKFKD